VIGGRRPLQRFVIPHRWDRLLYNQSAKRLKSALVGREHTVIADGPLSPRPLTEPPAQQIGDG